MKKLTSLLLCMVLVLSLFGVNAAAAGNPCMEAGVTAADGTVTVVVTAKQAAANAHLVVRFDSDCLTYVGCETAFATHSVKAEEDQLTIGLASATADAVEAGENLVELRFEKNGSWKNTEITITAETYGGSRVDETVTVLVGDRFQDVSQGQWFYEGVEYMASKGYINGVSATHFAPDMELNRAMMVTILYRMAGTPAVNGTNVFTDVPANDYYTNAVIWATENGITNGISQTKFAPFTLVNREQMVTFLQRYAKLQGADVTVSNTKVLEQFPDNAKVSDWAVEPFCWAVENGIINGDDGLLAAWNTATRAQVTVMLYRYILAQ
jgi:hypothetical protein